MALSHKSQVLYRASIERMAAAGREFDAKDYALCMYLSGLAVECILQAIALRFGAAHDARHDLVAWAGKCPTEFQDCIKGSIAADWNRVVALWDNGLRYLPGDGLLGFLRRRGFGLGVAGGPESIVRSAARVLLDAARTVHNRGVAQWLNSTKK